MTVDEMDLVRQLKDAAPLRPGAYEQAQAMLRDTMAESGGRNRRRRAGAWGKAGIGAGIAAAAAAAAAIALVAAPAPRPAGAAGRAGAVAQAPPVTSKLVSLAALIKASGGTLPGDASLVIRTQTIDGKSPDVSYNLYTDSGAFYGGGDKKSLMQAVARHEDDAGGIDAREVAAARSAAAGDLAAARVRMVNASPNYLGLGLGPGARNKLWAQAKAKSAAIYKEKGITFPANPPTGKALREDADNYLWNNSVDALSAGGGDPQVREGALRLLSTISAVRMANSTAGRQPALTLTAGPEVFGGASSEVLTINARTGMPIKAEVPAEGNVPSSVQTFQVSRVTLAGIKAGQF
ncbi:MAG TPA: hypothetical protein VFQ68_00825 [Streptosporangiaceae bacterium]|nr:hypothetical protein [Streptosporangiaceae bacterium]